MRGWLMIRTEIFTFTAALDTRRSLGYDARASSLPERLPHLSPASTTASMFSTP
jgi:hypothetical protein